MIDTPEADVDVVAKPLSNEDIAKQRQMASIPTEPSESTVGDVVVHPSQASPAFNNMAEKLEVLMKEIKVKERHPDKSPALQEKTPEKPAAKIGDSQTPSQPSTEQPKPIESAPEEKTITSAKAADWKAIKEGKKLAEERAAKAEQEKQLIAKEYEEFRKKAVDVAKMEEQQKTAAKLKEERDTFERQLKDVAIERLPEFKNHYEAKFTDALTRARDAVGSKADQIADLLQLAPSKYRKEQINAIREELSGVDQGQLDIAIADYDRARKDRETAMKDTEANYQRMIGIQAERRNREMELQKNQLEAQTASILAMAKEKYESFKPSDNDDHNNFVKGNEEKVRKFFFGKLDGEDLFMLPIKAAEYERLSKSVIPDMEKKLSELQATVEEYQKTNPSPAGGKAPANAQQGGKKDFISHFNELYPAGNR